MNDERWRAIPSEPGYEASSLGRVRSVDRVVETRAGSRRYRGRVLTIYTSPNGYEQVTVRNTTRTVHSLVAEAWLGPRPAGHEVCHGPGGQQDNAPTNLRYDTSSANRYDAVRDGTNPMAARRQCPREHDLVAPNLVAHHARAGVRSCLACHRAESHRQAHRAAGRVMPDAEFRALADAKYAAITA